MEDVLQRIKASETRLEDHDRRLRNVEALHTQLVSLTTDLSVLVSNLKNIEKTVTTIEAKLDGHLMEPGANWKKLGWAVLMILVGAVMAVVIKQIGLGG